MDSNLSIFDSPSHIVVAYMYATFHIWKAVKRPSDGNEGSPIIMRGSRVAIRTKSTKAPSFFCPDGMDQLGAATG